MGQNLAKTAAQSDPFVGVQEPEIEAKNDDVAPHQPARASVSQNGGKVAKRRSSSRLRGLALPVAEVKPMAEPILVKYFDAVPREVLLQILRCAVDLDSSDESDCSDTSDPTDNLEPPVMSDPSDPLNTSGSSHLRLCCKEWKSAVDSGRTSLAVSMKDAKHAAPFVSSLLSLNTVTVFCDDPTGNFDEPLLHVLTSSRSLTSLKLRHRAGAPTSYATNCAGVPIKISNCIIFLLQKLQHLELFDISCSSGQKAVSCLSFLSQLTALKSLTLKHVVPSLVTADLAGCALLEKLTLSRQLSFLVPATAASCHLNMSACTSLLELDCTEYGLMSLDVSGCTKLQKLDCSLNRLRVLDLTHHSDLKQLWCTYNGLCKLDLGANTQLAVLACDDNRQLSSLQLPDSASLTSLSCLKASIPSLRVSQYTALQHLSCGSQHLTELEFSGCTALQALSIYCLKVGELDLRAFSSLQDLTLDRHSQLEMLNLAGLSQLKTFEIMDTHISKLDVTGCTALLWYQRHKDCDQVSYVRVCDCPWIGTRQHLGHSRQGHLSEGIFIECGSCTVKTIHEEDEEGIRMFMRELSGRA